MITVNEKSKADDEKREITGEKLTEDIPRKIMCIISRNLPFTTEIQTEFEEQFIPTIDTSLKLTTLKNTQNNLHNFHFYSVAGERKRTTEHL